MLVDKLGRAIKDLRVSIIDACNFRCPYCMPISEFGDDYAFLKKNELLTFEEIHRTVAHFVALGVNKIRLTGGEPLIRKGLEKLVAMLASIPGVEDIALTTNGYLLAQKAQALKAAGLKRVTISLDSLNEQSFKKMAGRDISIERVLKGIESAQAVGLTPIKINTVVQRGSNEEDIVPLARHFKGTGMTLRYIEYMDVGSANGWVKDNVVPAEDIIAMINKEFPLEAMDSGGPDVAKRYRYKDGTGEIGLITSVSQPFCRSCVRARISAEGKFYTCLFATNGTDLRAALRSGMSDEEFRELISNVWGQRTDRYSEVRQSLSATRKLKKVEMFQMGG
jgi:GTP 3',8-cyclase